MNAAMLIENFINETKDRLYEIEKELEKEDEHEYERAKAYWIAHIRMALDNDHGYLGGSMVTAEDTLSSLYDEEY